MNWMTKKKAKEAKEKVDFSDNSSLSFDSSQ
jgi:hypothetical protein